MTETLTIDSVTVLAERPSRALHSPVVFVHGYFADATVFARWLGFFAARGFPAYAVNLRGRAGSRPGTDIGRASIEDFVDDVSAVARWLGAPTVVGHSMGGLLAQRIAERGEARAVALICSAPPRWISVLSPRLLAKQVKYLPAILRSRPVRPSREDLRELVLNRVPPAEQDALLDRFIADSGRAARDMSITGVAVDAGRVRCPVFAIASDDDRFIPKRIGERIAAKYGVPLTVLAGHGHMVPCEPGWEEAAGLVATWSV